MDTVESVVDGYCINIWAVSKTGITLRITIPVSRGLSLALYAWIQ